MLQKKRYYIHFLYLCKIKGLLLLFKCTPFGLQKDSFYTPEGLVLQRKRTPFEKLSETNRPTSA